MLIRSNILKEEADGVREILVTFQPTKLFS